MKNYMAVTFLTLCLIGAIALSVSSAPIPPYNGQPVGQVYFNCNPTPGGTPTFCPTPFIMMAPPGYALPVTAVNAASISLVVFQASSTLTTSDGAAYGNTQGFLDTTPVTVASMSSTTKASLDLSTRNNDVSSGTVSVYVNGILDSQYVLVPGAFVDIFKNKVLAPSSNVYCTGTTLISYQSDLRTYPQ